MSIARILDRFNGDVESFSSARQMSGRGREAAALRVLAGDNVAQIAENKHVSRQFLYKQEKIALKAIDAAFAPLPVEDEDKVIFTVCVTKARLRQIVLALVLRCHSSLRGVVAFLADVFDCDLSLGTVHNIVAEAAAKAQEIARGEDLSKIKSGAHDEIFQAEQPVLVGVDCVSTYCYMLAAAEHCDRDTWGYHLLCAQDRGLKLDYVVADQGTAQRAGLAEAFPGVPCGVDIFHILRDFGQVIGYYENVHKGAYTNRSKIEAKVALTIRRGRRGNRFSYQLAKARQKERSLASLVDDLTTLLAWLHDDVLAVYGMTAADRSEMYDFIVEELDALAVKRPKVAWLRRRLANAKAELLGIVVRLDERLANLAASKGVSKVHLDKASAMLGRSDADPRRYELEAELRRAWRDRFHEIVNSVADVMTSLPRASSLAENLNSILRSYFFLRREAGGDYLDLLRFYLNHRIIERSERPEREGKTPRQLLTGEPHPHWLEMLGFERFRRGA